MKKGKIKNLALRYLLAENEKEKLRKRLEQVLNQKDGTQVIILMDKEKLTDYYQNICGEHLMENIESSARQFSELTNGKLIYFTTK